MSIGRRDVILQLIRDYQSLNGTQVEYRDASPTALQFSRVLRSNRPVVFKEAVSHWPALKKWNHPDYLRRVMEDRLITVAETPDGNADSIVDGFFVEPHQNTIPFSEMLEWLLSRRRSDREGPVRYVQSQNGNLLGEFELLRADVYELDWANDCFGESPDATNIWIGNDESTTSLHLDHYENIYCQIVGSKTFYLVPPSEFACLKEQRFPHARWKPSEDDPTRLQLIPTDSMTPWLTIDPSHLKPEENDILIRNCKPLVVTLHPGEVLYLPALWFHSVYQNPNSDGLCIAVNYWYDMDFTGPLYPLFKFLRGITMIEDGRSGEVEIDMD